MQVGSDFQAQRAPLEASSSSPHHSSVTVTLEEPDLWAKFHHTGTEMIITKTGRRMFPQFKMKVTGLIPYAKYLMLVDFMTTDNFRYKWNKDKWQIAGKAEPQPPCRTHVHPDSPALGSHWMKEPVSFQKLKLTNNTLGRQGHAACKRDAGPFIAYDRHRRGDHAGKVNGEYATSLDATQHFICLVVFEDRFLIYGIHGDIVLTVILHSMHRYKPRFHVMQADGLFSTHCSIFHSFSFPETVFTSVTAYQNEQITKPKIYNNPFAKGFREHGRNVRHRERTGWGRNAAKGAKMAAPPLPTGEGAAEGSHAKGKAKGSLTTCGAAGLSGPSDPTKIPAQGASEEQQEWPPPASLCLQARFPAAVEASLSAPFKDLSTFNEFRARPHQLDFPMLPQQDPKPHGSLAATPLLPLWQDNTGVTGHAEEPAGKLKPQGLTCAPYAPDQSSSPWVVPPTGEHRAGSYATFSAGSSGSTARGRADWSQWPPFPYACW